MRLFRLTTNYPRYLAEFYRGRPRLQTAPFREQYRALMQDCFGWADFWSQALAPLGYDVWEPVANAEPLQRAWAAERGLRIRPADWTQEIALAQLRWFRPEVVLAGCETGFDATFFQRLREACPSVRLVIGRCGAPCRDAGVFSNFDLVLSNIPGFVDEFRRRGLRCEYLAHAFSPLVLERIDASAECDTGLCFVGSVVKADGYHNSRERLLRHLVERTDLQIFGLLDGLHTADVPRAMLKFAAGWSLRASRAVPVVGRSLERVRAFRQLAAAPPPFGQLLDRRLFRCVRPALFGRAMYEQLSRSRAVLNQHIDASSEWASNMRLFEATGVGACLLTDWKPNLREFFEPDREVVSYRSTEEAVEMYEWLKEHPRERQQIAQAGQARTLRDHTFAKRAVELDEQIRHALKRSRPRSRCA